ncbi:MAG: PAS domain S-box protein [Bacteroidota bacterium]
MKEDYKILVVEDDEITVMAYKRMFSSWDEKVDSIWCKSIRQAKEAIENNDFEAAVLDYLLPDGDAFDLMPLIKGTPIIFVSGMEDISIAVKAMKQGAFDYLVKDFSNDFVEALPLIINKAVRNHRIELELRKTEKRYSDLFQLSNDLIISIDFKGNLLYVNPSWLSIMEYSPIEVSELHFLETVQDEEKDHCLKLFENLKRGRSYKNEEISFLTKSGKRIFAEGNIFTNTEPGTTIIGIFRDITERKESEKRLIEAKARYDLAVDAGKTGIMDWDLESQTLYIDDKLKSLLGYKPEELDSTLESWYSRVHTDDKPKVSKDIKAYVKGEIPKYEFEYKMCHKDGSDRWLLARAKAIRNGGNKVLRIIGTGTDVTFQKKIQSQLEQREKELQDINDNLEHIVTNRTKKLSQANEYLQSEVERRKLTEIALEDEKTQRVSALIDGQEIERKRLAKELHDSLGQLLTAAKLQIRQTIKRAKDEVVLKKVQYTGEILDITMQEVRRISQALMPVLLNDYGLATALEKMIEQVTVTTKTKIQFKKVGDPENRLSKEVEIAMYRICQEALNNALKYSHCSQIEVVLEVSDHLGSLHVKDDGKGMSEKELNKIYNTPSGSGIYNMKERAELIKAEFVLESNKGSGTLIEITVPI